MIDLHLCLLGASLSFFSIAAKACNQKAVQYNRYLMIPPVSYIQALSELFTAGLFSVSFIGKPWMESLPLALSIATGGWMGCMAGMRLQAFLVRVLYNVETKK